MVTLLTLKMSVHTKINQPPIKILKGFLCATIIYIHACTSQSFDCRKLILEYTSNFQCRKCNLSKVINWDIAKLINIFQANNPKYQGFTIFQTSLTSPASVSHINFLHWNLQEWYLYFKSLFSYALSLTSWLKAFCNW